VVPWFVFVFASYTNHQSTCAPITFARRAGRRTMPNCSATCAVRGLARVVRWPRFASLSSSRGRGMVVAIISIAVAILLGRDLLAQSAPAATLLSDSPVSDSPARVPDAVPDTSRAVEPLSAGLRARGSLMVVARSRSGIANELRFDTAATDTAAIERKNHHAFLGMAIGAAAGAGIGYVLAKSNCHDHAEGPPCELGNRLSAVWLGAIGLVVGGVVGSFVHREIPLRTAAHVSIGAAPLGGGNAMFVIQIR